MNSIKRDRHGQPTRDQLLEWRAAIRLEKLGLGETTRKGKPSVKAIATKHLKLRGTKGRKRYTYDEIIHAIDQRLEEIKLERVIHEPPVQTIHDRFGDNNDAED